MKFYISSRMKNKELVKDIHNKLTQRGHEILSTWVNEEKIKPYEKNLEIAKLRALQCIKNASECDVFILVSDEAGTGMYTELGFALLANSLNKKPKIYVIGDYLGRSMFFFHPATKRFKTLEEVLEDLRK